MFTRDDWNKFVLASPHASFLQSWEWGEMQRHLGVPHWRLTVGAGTAPTTVALVVKRILPWGYGWLYLPHGPVGVADLPTSPAWADFTTRLQDLAQRHHALFVRLDPKWPAAQAAALTRHSWRKAERDVQPRHTRLLDLRADEGALLAAMHSKTRYNIRLAEKHGVTVRFSTSHADLESFLALAGDVQNRSPFRYHPPAYYRTMLAALGPANMLELAVAEHEGIPLAVHVLVTFGSTVTYVHGASSSSHRHLMAPHLAQWASITRARARGASHYDFFGVAPATVANHPWAGITRFKEGFGGYAEEYVGAYDLVLDPTRYAAFTFARRARALWR